VYLADGDVMDMSITGLGALRNTVHVPAPRPALEGSS